MEAQTLRQTSEGVLLSLKAVPNAHTNQVMRRGAEIHVSVTQAAERGRANQAIVELLARALGIAKSRIEFTRGAAGRRKTVLLRGCLISEVRKQLGF